MAAGVDGVLVDGVFVEVHDCPKKALSDGANALRVDLWRVFGGGCERYLRWWGMDTLG